VFIGGGFWPGWWWGWPYYYGSYWPYYGYPYYGYGYPYYYGYGYPYAYGYGGYPYYSQSVAPAAYVEAAPVAAQASWYYCSNPAGWYPYVRTCSQPWQTVPAQSLPPNMNQAPSY
jgi:hypothetical protein